MHNSKGLSKDHHNHKLIYGPPFPPRSTQAAKNAVRVIFKMAKYTYKISAIEEHDKRVVEPRPFLPLKSHYESDTLQKESVVVLASGAPTYFRPTLKSVCFSLESSI